jgi:hypothetical protein
MAFNQLAVAFRITAADGGHGGFVLLRAGHFGWHHLKARHPRREIVTAQND